MTTPLDGDGARLREVHVVVVTFRNGAEVLDALRALPLDELAGVTVLDNASDDDTLALLRGAGLANVHVIAEATNHGFGAGVNIAERVARDSRYMLVLNPDARIDRPMLLELLRYAHAHPKAALVAPRVFTEDGRPLTSAGRIATVSNELRYVVGPKLAWLFPERRFDPQYDESGRVDVVEGACMLFDRAAFRRVGGFDPRFFLFFEEHDIARRLRKIDREAHLCASARVVHTVGTSRSTLPLGARGEYVTSAVRYLRKHHGAPKAAVFRTAAVAMWHLRQRLGNLDDDEARTLLEAARRA